jgi:4-amino-4-deoxychorismate lyase
MVNGEFTRLIDIADRGLQYGDGLFETMRVRQRECLLWDAHMERLGKGCGTLDIPMPDRELLAGEVRQLIAASGREDAVLKLVVTRGTGGRGYRSDRAAVPQRILSLHPLPRYPETHYREGIRARFCTLRLGLQPALAGIKHLNRLEQVLARQEWGDEFDEGIMLDVHGNVIEGVMSNIFILFKGQLQTPSLAGCGVAGVVRGQILQRSDELGVPVSVSLIRAEELMGAEAVFFTNSIIGVWQLHVLEGHIWSPHPLLEKLVAITGSLRA